MNKRPLIETNAFLRDPQKLRKALIINVSSSTAIETGAPIEAIARMLMDGSRINAVKTPLDSAR